MSSQGNGINAATAHQMRSGDDNIFVRSIIEGYTFVSFGKVLKYLDGRVTVQCGSLQYTNVEVPVIGINGWGIKPILAIGDRVMLVSSQIPIINIKHFTASGTMPPYDPSGLKAFPVTDDDTAQLVTVSKEGIDVTGSNKIRINDAGIQVEDKNGNKVTTSADGVAFEDKNGNKVTADSNGVAFEDTNGNKVTTSSDGVAFEDKNGNKTTTSSDGVAFEDKNGNKVTTASAGMTVEDKNGCKIETSSSSVKINGKLEIKK